MTQKQLANEAMRVLYGTHVLDLREINVTEIARRLGVSISNLSRAYRNYMKETLVRSIQIHKLWAFQCIAQLYPHLKTVKAVLEAMDIESAGNFGQRYKMLHGETPGQTIKKIKEEERQKREKNS
ncbi:MAG: AraC family transcriptional regulator [bacterium]|nr:AraC family transcriptional regulator [bacterium]